MIHLTIGVYPNGERKTNAVKCENLASHIWYNLHFRPGRALVVDGHCIHKGLGVDCDDIAKAMSDAQERLENDPPKVSSEPYV